MKTANVKRIEIIRDAKDELKKIIGNMSRNNSEVNRNTSGSMRCDNLCRET